jgi:hypothetical protein
MRKAFFSVQRLDGVGYSEALLFGNRINALAYFWDGNVCLAGLLGFGEGGEGDVVVDSGRQVTKEGNINILNINLNFFSQQGFNY